MSFLQRIGRAGRKTPGLVAFLPSRSNNLEHPDVLLGNEVEKVAFNPDYPIVLGKHLYCAAVETGLSTTKVFGTGSEKLLKALEMSGKINMNKAGTTWLGAGYPHKEFSLRGGRFSDVEAIYDNKVLEKVPEAQALGRLFPGAIFLSQDSHGKLGRYDVISLDLDNKKAHLRLSTRENNVMVEPIRETKVKILQVWGEKYFSIASVEGCELHITFAWSNITTSVSGWELSIRSKDDRSIKERVIYDQPFQISYEAPCLKLALTTSARNIINAELESLLKQLFPQTKDSLELHERYRQLTSNEGAFVSIHTILHQLVAVVPLVLLSSNDVEEANVSARTCEGFLVDSVEGGTGICEKLFSSFLEYTHKAKELSECCSTCGGQWGCATCLFRHQCECRNESLLTAIGLCSLKLEEISQPSQSSQPTESADQPTFPLTQSTPSPSSQPSSSESPLLAPLISSSTYSGQVSVSQPVGNTPRVYSQLPATSYSQPISSTQKQSNPSQSNIASRVPLSSIGNNPNDIELRIMKKEKEIMEKEKRLLEMERTFQQLQQIKQERRT